MTEESFDSSNSKSNSNFDFDPNLDPNPNSGADFNADADVDSNRSRAEIGVPWDSISYPFQSLGWTYIGKPTPSVKWNMEVKKEKGK